MFNLTILVLLLVAQLQNGGILQIFRCTQSFNKTFKFLKRSALRLCQRAIQCKFHFENELTDELNHNQITFVFSQCAILGMGAEPCHKTNFAIKLDTALIVIQNFQNWFGTLFSVRFKIYLPAILP